MFREHQLTEHQSIYLRRIIQLFAGQTRFTQFCAVFNFVANQKELATPYPAGFWSLQSPDEQVEFRDPC